MQRFLYCVRAVSMNSELIKLYDIRSFEKGPFLTFRIGRDSSTVIPREWASVRFSPDGRFIAVASTPQHLSYQPAAPPDYASLSIRIIDAFNGSLNTMAHPYSFYSVVWNAQYTRPVN